jgi:lysophospholipase L1-like esterase
LNTSAKVSGSRGRLAAFGVNALLFAIVSLACALVVELVARSLFKDTVVLFPRYHTSAMYGQFSIRRLRPNEVFTHTSVDGRWQFRTNSQGYRNDFDFRYEKPAGLVRVLVLGDSHTQGFEVNQDESYSAVLQKLLSSSGLEAEVMNVGVSGFSTAEALVYLEQEGVRYRPDYVVLGFFANDFEDNLKAGLYALNDDGQLTLQRTTHVPGVRVQDAIYSLPFTKWLGENSYAYSIAFNWLWDVAKHALSDKAREQVTEYAVATRSTFNNYEVELAQALVGRMQDVSRAAGARFVVVDVPQNDPAGRVFASMPREMAASTASAVDHYVDIAKIIAGTPLEKGSHLPRGHKHISAATHRVIAKELQRIVTSRAAAPDGARDPGQFRTGADEGPPSAPTSGSLLAR